MRGMTVQFITHCTERYNYLDSVRMALAGGCRWVQLRMKDAAMRDIYNTAVEARAMCREAGATLIVDDHVDVAMAAHADGVHLGQSDLPVREARRLVGKDFIIGGTANTFEQVRAHATDGADYVGCGPFRFTTTKRGLAPVLGLDGYRRIVEQMRREDIQMPIVAIGGIGRDDIKDLMDTGVQGIALSGGVLRADHPVVEMRRIMDTFNGI